MKLNLHSFRLLFVLSVLGLTLACSADDGSDADKSTGDPSTEDPNSDDGVTGNTDGLIVNNKALREDGYVLVNDPGNNRVYIMNKDDGTAELEWSLPQNLGNDAKLLENGVLMVSMRAEDPQFQFGGYGGVLQLLNKNNEQLWSFDLSNADLIAHHDVVMLPNGNVLTILWERSDAALSASLGYSGSHQEIFTETIVEIDPETDEIVWRWDSRDHLVQDVFPELPTYGNVATEVRKIDINYKDDEIASIPDNGDLMHANGITYDPGRDLIYMSVNYYSEVWVIDHSTTTEEASGKSGGNYGVGGDLVYRFGNPSVFRNESGIRYLYNNHTPRLLPETDHIMLFMNGNHTEGPSVVYEFDLPDDLSLESGIYNEPSVVWEYSHPDMYSAKVSGAERLPNGNTLIAVGTYGFWEVTPEKKVVWQYKDQGFFWRGYPIGANDPVLEILGVR